MNLYDEYSPFLLDALVAFESAALHEIFTRAVAELNLTQGVISRRIRALEDRLGSSLFQRVRHLRRADRRRSCLCFGGASASS